MSAKWAPDGMSAHDIHGCRHPADDPRAPENCQECDEPLDDADDTLYGGLCERCYREGQADAEDAHREAVRDWENERGWGAR